MTKQRPFAVFDIDGTLVRWQLFHAIVHHLGTEGFILRHHHEAIRDARAHWKNREDPEGFRAYERVLLDVYLDVLKHIRPEDHARIIDEVVTTYQNQVHTYTRDLAESLKQKGYLLFAVSGSHQIAVERVAQHHGFDAAIGATFRIVDDAYTGECVSPVHNKKAAVQALVKQFDATYEGSYAVGDSSSDIGMLELVTNPIVFNPDKSLFETARKNHWPVVVERKNVVYEMSAGENGYSLDLEDSCSSSSD